MRLTAVKRQFLVWGNQGLVELENALNTFRVEVMLWPFLTGCADLQDF